MPAPGGWPEPIERVAAAFRRSGVEAAVEELTIGVATADEAAATLGVSRGEIATTQIVFCDDRPLAILIGADRRISTEKLEKATGAAAARIASDMEIRDLTGFEPGSVPPIPLPSHVPLYIDRLLLALRRIWVSAGSSRHLLSCTPADLMMLADAQLLDGTEADG